MAETALIVSEKAAIISAVIVTIAFVGSFAFLLIAAAFHR